MASRLGKHLLRVKSKAKNFALFALYPCYFFVCCLAAPWLTFDQSLIHLMLIIVFGLRILVQRLLGGVGSHLLIRCPVGFDHNDITHLPTCSKLQKILSPDLHLISPKCGNAANNQSSYSFTLYWPLGLHNTSFDAKFSVQNFSFC